MKNNLCSSLSVDQLVPSDFSTPPENIQTAFIMEENVMNAVQVENKGNHQSLRSRTEDKVLASDCLDRCWLTHCRMRTACFKEALAAGFVAVKSRIFRNLVSFSLFSLSYMGRKVIRDPETS